MSVNINVSREELGKKSLFIAAPLYGGQCHGTFTRSMMDLGVLLNHWGIQQKIYFLFNESLITRARNYCADEFLRSDCTHLLFVDGDIGFNPQDVLAMLAMASDDSSYDVLTGPYPKKCIAFEKIKLAVDKGFADNDPNELGKFCGDFVFNPLPGTNSFQLNAPVEVLEAGTGFMMIQRRAFAKLDAARPDLRYFPDHARAEHFDGSREIMAYFCDPIDVENKEKEYEGYLKAIVAGEILLTEDNKNIIDKAINRPKTGSRRLLSEDFFFCQELRKAGGHIWLCPWMALTHTGSFIFDTTLQHMAALGTSATVSPEMLAKNKKPSKAAALRDRTKGAAR